jgi:hypothetical protein
MKALQWLIDGMNNVGDKFITPGGVIEEGDEVVGKITDPEIKKLLTLRASLIREHAEAKKTRGAKFPRLTRVEHDCTKCPGCLRRNEVSRIEEKLQILGAILPNALHESLELKEQITVRSMVQVAPVNLEITSDWQVVMKPQVVAMSMVEVEALLGDEPEALFELLGSWRR